MAGFVALAKADDIADGTFKPVQADGRRLLVCRVEGRFHVIDDTCSHDDGPLAEGFLDGTAIECPRHGARFDVTTGRVLCLPAAVGIRSYASKVEGGQVYADLG